MPATPITPVTRFFHPGLTKVIFATAMTKAAPTRAQINAGTDISGDVADWSGWAVRSTAINTPDLGSRFTSTIGGRTEAGDSSITFYADDNGADIRSLLPRDTVGYILIADGGDVAGNKADVFAVQVRGVPKDRSLTEAGRITVEFGLTSEPAENVAIPA